MILLLQVGLLVEGQRFVVRGFEDVNDHAVAARRAIEMALSATTARRIVVADASLVAAVAARTGHSGEIVFVLDYTNLSRRTLPRPGGNVEEQAAADAHRERLFEYFARLGMSPADVGQALEREAASIGTGSGFLLHFLFHLADVWYPLTDSRQTRPDRVAEAPAGHRRRLCTVPGQLAGRSRRAGGDRHGSRAGAGGGLEAFRPSGDWRCRRRSAAWRRRSSSGRATMSRCRRAWRDWPPERIRPAAGPRNLRAAA